MVRDRTRRVGVSARAARSRHIEIAAIESPGYRSHRRISRAPDGNAVLQYRAILGKSASVGPRRGKDHPCRDRSRVPAARLDDLRSKATAPVHGAQQVTDVHELGLELDDQESPALGMPEQRDRSHRARPRSRKTPLTPSPSQGSRGRERSRPTRAVPSGERSRADQVQPLCREEAARAGSRARRPLAEGQPASSPGSARARPSRRPSARRRPVSPGRPDARRVSGVRPGSCSRSGDRPRKNVAGRPLRCHLVAPGLLGIEAAPRAVKSTLGRTPKSHQSGRSAA